MSQRFVKAIPSEETQWLLENQPNAFLLLSCIAFRVRVFEGGPDNLGIGECFIGDYKSCGIETRDRYRYALDVLKSREHIIIIETCRSRKKATPTETPTENGKKQKVTPTETPTVGTKVKLISSNVYDLNLFLNPHRNPHPPLKLTPTETPTNEERNEERNVKERYKKDVRGCGNVHNSVDQEKPGVESCEHFHTLFSSFDENKKISFPSEDEVCLQTISDFSFYCGQKIKESTIMRWMKDSKLTSSDIMNALKYYQRMEKLAIEKQEYFQKPEAYFQSIIKGRHWENHQRREKVKIFEKEYFKGK